MIDRRKETIRVHVVDFIDCCRVEIRCAANKSVFANLGFVHEKAGDRRKFEIMRRVYLWRIGKWNARLQHPSATQVAACGFFANLTPEQQAAALAERELDI